MVKIVTLRNRKDFIRAAQGLKVVCNSLIIQAAQTLPAKKEKKEKIFYTDEHSSAAYKDVREEASTGKCLQNPLKNRFHIGFTATKKLGKAHIRNRVKRRLRAAARDVLPDLGKDGFNYVLIGRYNTEKVPFDLLKKDLKKGVKKLNNLLKEKENAGKNPHLDN